MAACLAPELSSARQAAGIVTVCLKVGDSLDTALRRVVWAAMLIDHVLKAAVLGQTVMGINRQPGQVARAALGLSFMVPAKGLCKNNYRPGSAIGTKRRPDPPVRREREQPDLSFRVEILLNLFSPPAFHWI